MPNGVCWNHGCRSHAARAAAATAPIATHVVLIELDFATGPFRVWTGLGPLDWAGKVFEGAGSIGAISDVGETVELRAVGLALTHHVSILTMNGDSYRLKQFAGHRRAPARAEQNQA